MSILLSDLLGTATPRGRLPISPRIGPQLIGELDSNTMVVSNDTAAVSWLLDATADLGTCVRMTQGDVGLITLAVSSGGTYQQALGFHTSGGANTEMVATVISNPDGLSATWLVTGAMQSP